MFTDPWSGALCMLSWWDARGAAEFMRLRQIFGAPRYHKSQEVGGTRLPGRLSSFVRAFHALLDNNAGRGGLALCAAGRLDADVTRARYAGRTPRPPRPPHRLHSTCQIYISFVTRIHGHLTRHYPTHASPFRLM
uniref:SFRICE_003499 n=1 Tax=Spodoptera frugiperda TaxID=7108 RepID=A0A2H1WZS4_SPOFR